MSIVDLRAVVSQDADGTVVVCLDGDLDLTTAPVLAELLATAVNAGTPSVVVDLSDVTSVDIEGLRAMADAHALALEGGGSIRLRSPSTRTLDLLLMTGLDRALPIDTAYPRLDVHPQLQLGVDHAG